MKRDQEIMQSMANDVAEALDKYEESIKDPVRLAAHQLEAVTTVLGAMLVDFGIPVEIGQSALGSAYKRILEKAEDESIH
jgi:hypothetical protein